MANINRNIISSLSNWAKESDRKPLLIRGARQVGKSWAVRQWCKEEGRTILEINFEEQPVFSKIFDQDLNASRIANELSTVFDVSLKEKNTVLFLDEIQRAPKAITALRYFYETLPEVTVVAAGSLVEFVLEEYGLPVGRVQSHFLHPLSFVEFLKASGKHGLAQTILEFSPQKPNPLPSLVHQELLSLLKLYYRIGGMPKVVSTYLNSNDLTKAGTEQATLVRGYIDDFRKYAKKLDWSLLETVFDKMGDLAGGSPIKFSAIDAEAKSVQVRRVLMALQHAMIIHKILPTHTTKLPLGAHAVDKHFKLSFLDIGLLHQMLGFDWSVLPPNTDLTDIASGRFAEQFVSQEIITARSGLNSYSLHCWNRNQRGSEAEVDFVIEQDNQPVPVEVKSGARGRLKSLELYLKELNPPRAFVLSQRNVETMGPITFMPLYLACRL